MASSSEKSAMGTKRKWVDLSETRKPEEPSDEKEGVAKKARVEMKSGETSLSSVKDITGGVVKSLQARKPELSEKKDTVEVPLPTIFQNIKKLLGQDRTKGVSKSLQELFEMKPGQTSLSSVKEAKTLFFSNLCPRTIVSDIIHFFKDVGQVVRVQHHLYPDGKLRGDGFVEFASANEAEKALQNKNGRRLNGRRIVLAVASEDATNFPREFCRDHRFWNYESEEDCDLAQDKAKGLAGSIQALVCLLGENWAKLTEGYSLRKK